MWDGFPHLTLEVSNLTVEVYDRFVKWLIDIAAASERGDICADASVPTKEAAKVIHQAAKGVPGRSMLLWLIDNPGVDFDSVVSESHRILREIQEFAETFNGELRYLNIIKEVTSLGLEKFKESCKSQLHVSPDACRVVLINNSATKIGLCIDSLEVVQLVFDLRDSKMRVHVRLTAVANMAYSDSGSLRYIHASVFNVIQEMCRKQKVCSAFVEDSSPA